MKIKVKMPVEINVHLLYMVVAVRYEEEDIPYDFPLRSGETWSANIEVNTGRILNWPDNPRFQECDLSMKVCDEGSYILYDNHGICVAKLGGEYVPNGLVPGRYGDYVDLHIKNGLITNWPKKPDLTAFFRGKDEE